MTHTRVHMYMCRRVRESVSLYQAHVEIGPVDVQRQYANEVLGCAGCRPSISRKNNLSATSNKEKVSCNRRVGIFKRRPRFPKHAANSQLSAIDLSQPQYPHQLYLANKPEYSNLKTTHTPQHFTPYNRKIIHHGLCPRSRQTAPFPHPLQILVSRLSLRNSYIPKVPCHGESSPCRIR